MFYSQINDFLENRVFISVNYQQPSSSAFVSGFFLLYFNIKAPMSWNNIYKLTFAALLCQCRESSEAEPTAAPTCGQVLR